METRGAHVPPEEFSAETVTNYLRSPSMKLYKKLFFRKWYRKIRSRCKQNSNRRRRKIGNIYAAAHRQTQEKCNNYWSSNTLLTFSDVYRNEKLLLNNANAIKMPFKATMSEYNRSRIEKISDCIYHVFPAEEKRRVSFLLANFFYECPICLGNKDINGSFLHDCGHLLCNDCVSQTIDSFPNASPIAKLFEQCPVCRSKNSL